MLDLISELKSSLFHGIKTKDIRHIVGENSLRFFTKLQFADKNTD